MARFKHKARSAVLLAYIRSFPLVGGIPNFHAIAVIGRMRGLWSVNTSYSDIASTLERTWAKRRRLEGAGTRGHSHEPCPSAPQRAQASASA